MSFYFDLCPKCNRPLVNGTNVWKLRAALIPIATGAGFLGAALLPFLGFGAGGIAAGSTAAAWQSSLGVVAAGSLFAILQTLGATGVGTVLFGSIGAAIPLLGSIALELSWCTGSC